MSAGWTFRPSDEICLWSVVARAASCHFKVSIYRNKWKTCFSENVLLGIGEAPRWTPVGFLRTPYKNESMERIVNIARMVQEILRKEIKPYYDDLNF